jgi:type III secretion protein L
MASIGLTRRASVLTAVEGTRVPRDAWSNLKEVTDLLREANSVLEASGEEAQSVLKTSYEQGYAAGKAAAQAELLKHLLGAQHTAREFVAASEERLVSLAVAIVQRIAPKLGKGDLVAALAHEAVSTLHAERHLRICVAPQALEATRLMLEEWQRAHPEIGSVTVESRAELDPFACLVESELGHIEGSLPAQLAAIRDALTAKPTEALE